MRVVRSSNNLTFSIPHMHRAQTHTHSIGTASVSFLCISRRKWFPAWYINNVCFWIFCSLLGTNTTWSAFSRTCGVSRLNAIKCIHIQLYAFNEQVKCDDAMTNRYETISKWIKETNYVGLRLSLSERDSNLLSICWNTFSMLFLIYSEYNEEHLIVYKLWANTFDVFF